MTTHQGRATIAVLGVIAVAVVSLLFALMRWDERIGLDAPGPVSSEPAKTPAEPEQKASPGAPPPGAAAKTEAATAPRQDVAPPVSFDVVRVEPNGESVIAGRGPAGATIEMLRDGEVFARAVADTSGLFALVPPPLPAGTHQVSLQAIAPDGARQRSNETVTIVISEGRDSRPLVALASPDKPTVVLSNPEAPETKKAEAASPAVVREEPKPAEPPAAPAGPRPEVRIVTVEAEEGRLFVSGQAAPGATLRFYLNETLIAPGGAGGDGKVSFAIARGVKPGDYRVRLDDVDPVSGTVKSRAEVAFNVPAMVSVPAPPATGPAVVPPAATVASSQNPGSRSAPASSAAAPTTLPGAEGAAGTRAAGTQVASAQPDSRDVSPTVVIPDVTTAIVSRGDNLWRISQRIYGRGHRYTVIYGANQSQIRNPNLIYPGQVFVLPPGSEKKAQQ